MYERLLGSCYSSRGIDVRLQLFGSHLVQNRGFLRMKCRNPPGPGFLALWLRLFLSVTIEMCRLYIGIRR